MICASLYHALCKDATTAAAQQRGATPRNGGALPYLR